MSTTDQGMAVGGAPTETPEPLGFGAKLWNLYVDPRKTFASVRKNHEWVIIWLLVSAISIGAYLPIKGIVRQSQIAAVEERLDQNQQMDEDQKAEILNQVAGQFDNPIYLLFVPITQVLMIFIVAGVLLFVGNILLGGTAGYLRMLNGFAWTMLLVIPGSIVTVPLVMAKGSMDVSIGLGVLTSVDTGPFMKKLVSSFELFALWQVWLSSVAVSVIANVDGRKALYSVGAVWLVWVIIQAGLASLGISFGA